MIYALLAIAILELVVIVVLGIRSIKRKKAISKILSNATEIANKNIEVEDLEISGNSELAKIAGLINMIKLNMLAFIESTKGNVITLSDAIDALSRAAKASEFGIEQTSNSICTVAEKAIEQLDMVKDNLELIESNNNQLEEIENAMRVAKLSLGQSVDSCNVGISNLEQYENGMGVIAENLDRSVSILLEFNEQIQKVNEIGNLVVEISEELQLLALNASIEAARAGDAGKGFAVVSQEMGVLSEKTKDSMDEITEILQQVTASSYLVNDSINACNTAFDEGAKIFGSVSDSFRTISDQSKDINGQIVSMNTKYGQIAKNSDESKVKAESVYSASEVISESTRDVVAISEETSAESAQITTNVDSLEKMLVGIRNLIKQFKTGVVPSTTNRSKRVKIAVFSKLDNFFWYSIRRGVLYAQKELKDNNVDIIYIPYEDDIQECNFPNDVNKCVNEGVDAIIFPGFMNKADRELVDAVSKGVKIFTYNCDCNGMIKRISCYEPDQAEAGILAAGAVAKALNKSGNVAIILGDKTAAVNKIRYDSFVNVINTKYKDIKIINTTEVSYDAEKTYLQEIELIKAHPEIDIIYSTTGMQLQLAKAIEDTGMTGKIKAVVFDHNDEIFAYINKGIIAAAIDHDPFSQGHDSIIYMYNHIVDGMVLPADRIKCKANVVDSDNIKERVSLS